MSYKNPGKLGIVLGVLLVSAVLIGCQTVQEVTNPDSTSKESIPVDVITGEVQLPPAEQAQAVQPVIAAQAVEPVKIDYPNPILQLQSDAFSPNGDNFRDSLEFFAAIPVTTGLASWEMSLLNTNNQKVFIVRGTRAVPGMFSWNGQGPNGTQVPEGVYRGRLTAFYASGTQVFGESVNFVLRREGLGGTVKVPAGYFSPDGDGINDTVAIAIEVPERWTVRSHQISIFDGQENLFETYVGQGPPPENFVWDGKNRQGQTVEGASIYKAVVETVDDLGLRSKFGAEIPTDVLVYRDGDKIKIRISSITFQPYSANYTDVEPEQRDLNMRTLNRLVEILGRFPGYRIGIEGYAVQVYWYDTTLGTREQQQVLLPLSLARANAIRDALTARGIQASRMTTQGFGSLNPVVPNSDVQNRWKNRRVEFTLTR